MSLSLRPPDANFVRYVVLVPPETGVVKIVAISSDVSTNSSGDLLRDKFNALRSSLEANYGKAALVFDFLVPRSNWNEPSEGMMALQITKAYLWLIGSLTRKA